MGALVEIADVVPGPASGELAAYALDNPTAGRAGDTYAVDVRGWVVGARCPAQSVVVRRDGAVIRELPVGEPRPDVAAAHPELAGAERSGFFAPLGAMSLGRDFSLELEVLLEDGTRVPMAEVRGSRAPLRSGFEPRMQPLILTTMGRTGSTAVVRLLSAHPAIVAYRPFEQEPRVATYWMDVFRALAEPAGYRRQVAPTGLIEGTWWLGAHAPAPRRLRDPDLEPWLEKRAIEELAGFAQERIERFYGEAAKAQGRTASAWFVEKYRADADAGPSVPELMLELYPGAREVVLVRDFRDMVASMFSYDRKRGRQGFGRDRASGDADHVVSNLARSVAAMATAWRSRSDRAHLLRYEDLVTSPAETAGALLGHMGLAPEESAVDAMVKTLAAGDESSAGHRTVDDPAESIGRWRRDLSADVAAACEDAFASSLETFGYDRA